MYIIYDYAVLKLFCRDHKLNVAMIIATFSAVGGQIWCISENHTEREHVVDEIPKSSSKGLNAFGLDTV